MKKQKQPITVTLIIEVIVVIWVALTIWHGIQPSCSEGAVLRQVCLDSATSGTKVCRGGRWVASNQTPCGEGKTCEFGTCVGTECQGNEITHRCTGGYTVLTQKCVNGKFQNSEKLCDTDYYCDSERGECVKMPSSCGDGTCGDGEDSTNCWRDCGGLSDWDAYWVQARMQPNFKEDTECTPIFNCDAPEIVSLAEQIIKDYNVKTPKEYLDAVVDYVYHYGHYDLAGGYSQAGESATDVLEHAPIYGLNCVDYTVLTVALLRAKKLMAVQEWGCVDIHYTCRPLSFVSLGLQRLGHISGTSSDPLGHSWTSVWSPDKGWVSVDSTIGATASQCVSYDALGVGSQTPTWYIPPLQYQMQCVGG